MTIFLSENIKDLSCSIALRGHGEILMGKNTLIRKCLRAHVETNPSLER
jgi:hypothetical protein